MKAEAKAPVKAAAPAAKPTAQQVENATVPVEPGLTKDEITLIAQSAVEEKVAPLRQKIAELSNPNPSAKDVIGGAWAGSSVSRVPRRSATRRQGKGQKRKAEKGQRR